MPVFGVFGNASNIVDVEGTLAVGGNFDSGRGFSVNNGAYGVNPVSTDDVAFLINGNVNISGYGNVCGQTVVGNADVFITTNSGEGIYDDEFLTSVNDFTWN